MKNCNKHYISSDNFCFQMSVFVAQLKTYLENITNLEILRYLLHFSGVLKRMFIIKYFIG